METTVVHASKGDHHIVGIGSLRVVIKEVSTRWFAQGLEIDYAAEGLSLEDVKDRFERGLLATVDAHIKRFRTIEHLLVPAPSEVVHEIALGVSVKRLRYSCVSAHNSGFTERINAALPDGIVFPYSGINYLERAA